MSDRVSVRSFKEEIANLNNSQLEQLLYLMIVRRHFICTAKSFIVSEYLWVLDMWMALLKWINASYLKVIKESIKRVVCNA